MGSHCRPWNKYEVKNVTVGSIDVGIKDSKVSKDNKGKERSEVKNNVVLKIIV